ncbi:MAG: NAD(P)H-dependent oxidoreductase [Muribaculaceae bacterium]|nr:NAD(P)H-dependent oxidoreductase [Muribaculaceae bacterium]
MNTEKYLIAYFSQKGKEETSNSAKLAKQAAELLKAKGVDFETFVITPTEEYPSDPALFEKVTKSENELKARPELTAKYGGMKYVKGILLIAPNWWDSVPAAVRTFFDEYDFTGKRVVPVISTKESAAKVRQGVRDFLPNTWVLDGVDVPEDKTDSASAELSEAVAQLFQPSTSKH